MKVLCNRRSAFVFASCGSMELCKVLKLSRKLLIHIHDDETDGGDRKSVV